MGEVHSPLAPLLDQAQVELSGLGDLKAGAPIQ